MATTIRHNYKSDLEYIETFYERRQDGTLVKTKVPEEGIDIVLSYRAEDDRRFVATRTAGRYTNCRKVDESTIAVFIPLSRRSLGKGVLVRELILRMPDGNFLDKTRNLCMPAQTGVTLWGGPSDNATPSATGEAVIATILNGAYEAAKVGGFEGTESEFYYALGNICRSQSYYVPDSQAIPAGRFLRLRPVDPDISQDVAQQLYVGVLSRVGGKFRLIRTPLTGAGLNLRAGERRIDLRPVIKQYVQTVGFDPLPHFDSEEGYGAVDLARLLDAEFAPLTTIDGATLEGQTIPVTVTPTEDLPARMTRWPQLRFFTRRRFSHGYPSSLHNPLRFVLGGPGKGNITVDRVLKGNKQVLRRTYKVGLIRPKVWDAQTGPDWTKGYYCSTWHTVVAERVIYLYVTPHPAADGTPVDDYRDCFTLKLI